VSNADNEGQVVERMVTLMERVADQENIEERAAELNRTPYEILIIASMIEKEAKLDEDRPKIARVIYNRLFFGGLLQIDATLYYNESRDTPFSVLKARDTPYNTYIHPGLPPTPIANPIPATEGFESVTGKGVRATVEGRRVALGNSAMMKILSLDAGPFAARAEVLRGEGQTVLFAAVDGVVVGLLGVADPVKDGAAEAIRALHADDIRIVMLTGDNATTARAVAARLGIDEVMADVLPDQKADKVKSLQVAGRFVAMAGDGINDAPALAQANVGIAMGTGTDVAMESAGVTLVKGDLRGIARARNLSRATMANIRQNLWFAFGYNALGVPVAAGILYPWFGTLLSPMIAAAAMSFSSVSVIANSLRLRTAKLEG
jgi:soluble P-type ATPase